MANPNIAQGTLNRLRASANFPLFPTLNVVSSLLAPEAIDVAPEGQTTGVLPTMTGVVTSPEPYQLVRVSIHLLKSQSFSNLWKRQIEDTTLVGDCTIRPDASTLDPFDITNCSIMGIDRLNFGGREVGFIVNLTGAWNINASLWG